MVFQREEPGQYKAGALALLVHVVFLLLMVFGVSWQNQEPAGVEVELWEALPAAKPVAPRVEPEPKPEPRPEPRPKAAKPEPQPEAKPSRADIEMKARAEKRKKEEEAKEKKRKEDEQKKHRDEELKQEKEKQKLEREKLKEEQEKKKKAEQEKAEKLREQQAQAEARKAQAEAEARKAQAEAVAAQQAARARAVEGYVGKIIAKIRPRIVDQPCQPLGDPEVRFSITLMPTGELLFDPKLVKSSGAPACDQAIERAIMLAQPFPKPDTGVRDLNLIFWPNRKE